ncbi:hypothetical protein [Croceicoccus mobilis]|uniref:Ribbon-helix-helix domain-containing protein n=1 Tax=Croceicoccus mobilis TaxID=1703339 RepID=A0A916Z752_9SPHN|nr:hypothetical protein [Croceicoccus mobilis]GGD79298.1 hypothetical protein GCM10010990_31470 [Croceicoccus mobilis]
MPRRHHLACYVTQDIFDQFGALATSRHMTVTGLLRKLVVDELDAASLLAPGDLERNVLFTARAVSALLERHDPRLYAQVIATWRSDLAGEDRDDVG